MNNTLYKPGETSFKINYKKLDSFFSDSFHFRDAKAYSPLPGLVIEKNSPYIGVRNKFSLRQEFVITKEAGNQFVEITGDDNFIHRDSNIIPGAMTVSKIVAPLEILVPDLEILEINVKFLGFSFFNKNTRNIFFWTCTDPQSVLIEVSTYQDQGIIAKATIMGRINNELSDLPIIKEKKVDKTRLATVQNYFESLGVESNAYFQKETYVDYTYPVGFLASLPSAEIVNKMGGQGGMINVLKMNFRDHDRLPINGKSPIEVTLERAKKRTTFNKILAKIKKGVDTYCHGLAIVHPTAKLS